MYMVRLLVAIVNWHKSLQFVEKSNITLLPCLLMIFICRFHKKTTPQLLEHIGLQNMKVGVKTNLGDLPLFV